MSAVESGAGPACCSVVATYRRQVLDAHDKTEGVQNVGLAAAIQPRNCIETRIEIGESHSLRVRLEAVYADFLNIHPAVLHLLVRRAGLSARCSQLQATT